MHTYVLCRSHDGYTNNTYIHTCMCTHTHTHTCIHTHIYIHVRHTGLVIAIQTMKIGEAAFVRLTPEYAFGEEGIHIYNIYIFNVCVCM